MRSMFLLNGIHNPRVTSWMGQSSTTGNEWTAVASGITAGATAFKAYEQEQIAEENRRAEEQKRAAAEAAARTAAIQQQTLAMQSGAGKIMGIDKPLFYLGAAVVAVGALGALFVAMKGK